MKWKVGQSVMVQSRTWANINKPGGCAHITKIHTNRAYDNLGEDESSHVEGLDVKYVVSCGGEKNLDPAIVAPYDKQILERGGRSRRGRQFLMQREDDAAKDDNANPNTKKKTKAQKGPDRRRGRDNTAKEPPAKSSKQKQKQSKPTSMPMPIIVPGKENQKEPCSSRKSAATCSTPEPPRHARKKNFPKKVTPIPKVVLINTGKEADDVSPMWMDVGSSSSSHINSNKKKILSTTTNQKQSAARGLDFEEKASKQQQRGVLTLPHLPINALLPSKNSIIKNRKRPPPSRAQANAPVPSKRKKQTNHGKVKLKSRDHHPATDKVVATTVTAMPLPRYHHSKPIPKPSQTQPSFSRATSAYNTAKAKSKSRLQPHAKKPLLDVYRSEVEKARKFMDEMVGGPRNNNSDDTDNGNIICDSRKTKLAKKSSTTATASQPPKTSASPKSRYEEFLSHLYKVWRKVDDEDEISEDRFKTVFQEVSRESNFTTPELNTHLSALCEEGKEVMLSDGMLYRIH